MENIARQGMSITVESMDLLNKQIQMEARAASIYLAMASWCDQNGFFTSAKFFYKQYSRNSFSAALKGFPITSKRPPLAI